MNLSNTIIPKSDQLNADDLIAGPRTIKISAVEGGTPEQPVNIRFDGDNGRPYKPGKSMRRVLVAMWGSEGAAYIGRRLTLYCDPEITFGADKTGGIRISHASDIPANGVEIALTVKRGKRKPFRVLPLAAEPTARPVDELIAAGDAVAAQSLDALKAWWTKLPEAERALLGGNTGERLTAWKAAAQHGRAVA
jgi:hypothetical protein